MCTAAAYKTKDFYFGRTLDYEFSYGDSIVVMPRNYPIEFRSMGRSENHYAMIGMAHTEGDYPLYYDAVNEKGLGMAGLNFVGSAFYRDKIEGKDNVAQFEFIAWILSRCDTVASAKKLLERINIDNEPFSEKLPASQLHWLIADKSGAVTVESVKEGVKVYDNPALVLTNNPPFDMQMANLNNYMGLSVRNPENTFSENIPLNCYSRGMGAMGLPGDLSSQSRFVRAAFVRANSVSGNSEEESVSQFFHILGSVDQQRGCCDVGGGKFEITLYTSCCNADKGVYYYTTYDNHQISAVDMRRENLDGSELICFEPITGEHINYQN
ncbi:MAG: choloylglycine hydrolase [Ruminococcus sp.]|nr:choloylglycine hydrolase [Ruminococcus sp.]MCM1380613.1 choloylglycine hydrolase [Muribaculaceae bacterium]MCM1479826.1 choloylglycine hydrolase [Muribaculaceae bacterium]